MTLPFQRPNNDYQQPEPEKEYVDTGMFAPEKVDARWLWDYELLWLKFEADLRGGSIKRNPKTENWDLVIPKDAVPFMNERGIKDVLALLKANVSVISGSSITTEDRVLQWCERMQKDLCDMLYIRMKDYELDPAKFLAVVSTFMMNYEMNMRKSIGGRALVYATQTERRSIIEQVQPSNNGGFVSRIFGRR